MFVAVWIVNVATLGAVADAVICDGENVHTASTGRPLQASVTVPLKL